LLELVGTQGSWKAGASLVADAVPGSALSISMVPAPNMNIFYVDFSTENLYQIGYAPSSGGWSTRKSYYHHSLSMILLTYYVLPWQVQSLAGTEHPPPSLQFKKPSRTIYEHTTLEVTRRFMNSL
jgi:hypothetical protein